MKGIKKLFLGLVFLTLFGVAFKSEVKASTLSFSTETTDWGAIDDGDDAIVGQLDYTAALFPTADDTTYVYLVELKKGGSSITGSTKTYVAANTKNTGKHYIATNADQATAKSAAEASTTEVTADTLDNLAKMTKAQVVTALGGRGENSGVIDLEISQVVGAGGESVPKASTATIKMYKVNPTTNYPSDSNLKIEFCTGAKQYLLPGESTQVQAYVNAENYGYRFETFPAVSGGLGTTDPVHRNILNVKRRTSDTAATVDVTATFSSAGLTFTPELTTSTVVEPNTSKNFTYTFTGYTKDNVSDVKIGTASGGSFGGAAGASTGTFTLTPGAASNTRKTLVITMDDSNIFTREFFVVSTTDVITFDSDPICVTEGQEIDLYSWTDAKTGLEYVKTLEVMNKAKGKIQIIVGKKNYKNYLAGEYVGNIRIKGVETTSGTKASTGVDGIDMTSGTAGEDSVNVTVYPKPKIEVNSSSSSSSLNSSTSSSSSSDGQIKITMPTKVCYDDVENDDTKTAKVKLTTSKGSKEAELTMNKTTGDDGLARHDYINSTALMDILEDLCDSDVSKEVTIKAWPKGDDTVYAEEKFTAYRISLDGTAGAKYTVNGKDTSGHFYGIKGGKYTVKASAANGGTLDKTQSGDFNNGESFTFEVTGEKTLKAVYNGGASSSSSSSRNAINGEGGNLDDYDDVPKTGESKTDIWILWSVLFISILGAGFMIWKRFGLVRAIAEADEEVKIAEQEERIEKEAKAKEDKLNMLKDLRNL